MSYPGPAFIMYRPHRHGIEGHNLWWVTNFYWEEHGYRWLEATECTAAGWVKVA